jgi:hypothetical protein
VTLKLVYYGPALSGKTTNLQALHDRVDQAARGRLMSLATKDDRTLFFDLLPLAIRTDSMSLRVKIFTVPGQVVHASTRRFVLQGADGVAFIADSRTKETENNARSFRDLADNLKQLGRSMRDVPLVIQFNKRDLPDVRPEDELRALARKGREPVYVASAMQGVGVAETFLGLLSITCARLEAEHRLTQTLGISTDALLKATLQQFGLKGALADYVDAALPRIVEAAPASSHSPGSSRGGVA